MIWKFYYLLGLGILAGNMGGAAETQEGKSLPLKSPYFIDGLHCEGFNANNESVWPFNEEGISAVREVRNQSACDSIFSIYGVNVYEWYTPEKLESVANHLKKTEDFASAELSIKKSEMQNHVHLFLTVKPKTTSEKNIKVKINSSDDIILMGPGNWIYIPKEIGDCVTIEVEE
jgi:hypothetical protein